MKRIATAINYHIIVIFIDSRRSYKPRILEPVTIRSCSDWTTVYEMSDDLDVLTDREDLPQDSSMITADRNTDASFLNTRRNFIRGAAAAGLAGVGLSTNAAGATTPYDDEYDSVINIAEAGADTDGNEPITPILEDVRRDDTLWYFPPGRYAMDSQLRFTGFENFGIVGEDATIVPANYYEFDGPRYRLFRLGTGSSPGRRVRFEGLDIDQTAPDTGIRVIDTYAVDRLEVRNIHVHGQHDSGTWGPAHVNVTSSSGTGIVERFRAPDGGEWVENTPHDGKAWRGPIGIEANQNQGTLTFRRCWLGPFPSNGLYASGGSGRIVVNGGLFKNSNGANVRVGGEGSQIRWPTIEVDHTREEDRLQRGIRLENGRDLEVVGAAITITSPMPTSRAISVMNSCESVNIERSTIEMSGEKINHGIVISQGAGEVLIEETDIRHETAGGYPIWVRDSDSHDRVHGRSVTITGEAGDASGFRDGIRCERHNCRFSGCRVEQSSREGASRNAIVNTGDDLTVYDSTFRASNYPIVELGSETTYLENDAESTTGREGICLYDGVAGVRLSSNRLANGIKDYGAIDLTTYNNTF